ncbi:MAG TPA: DUF5106 domain-containing protein [Chitinophagaceae bacterium]|nr:DUF5106 domain-containing protein [Chitinophagaceae bacterium]
MMKYLLAPCLFFLPVLLSAQAGYEIKVTLKPFKNQYVYLGHYSGKQLPIVDSALLNDKSEGVFKGTAPLGGGIYLIGYPTRDRFIEILVDEKQHFSVIADTAKREDVKFINSPDNDLFTAYQKGINARGKALGDARNGLQTAAGAADSAAWNEKIKNALAAMSSYRKELISQHPNTLMASLLHLMQEPEVPPASMHPGGKYDTAYARYYFKSHYWDNINFWDDRISRTPASLFDEKLDKYFNSAVAHHPDSVNQELDWMLGYASVSKEMTKYLLVKFITRYMNMQYMWEDAVMVNLYQKYFAQKDYDWLTPQGKKMITDRAYNLMANMMGSLAPDITLPDSTGKIQALYAGTSPFTLVTIWDPTCGHCKEVLPKIDSMYRTKWKDMGVHIYAMAKETDGTQKHWLDFISQHHLQGWTHVYYSRAEEKKRVDAGIPGYTQLYDAQTVPALFLLDKEKKIFAKKMAWEQIDELLALKLKKP